MSSCVIHICLLTCAARFQFASHKLAPTLELPIGRVVLLDIRAEFLKDPARDFILPGAS